MSEHTYYVNGEFVLESKASISVKDLAILRGYGAFDYFRTYNGQFDPTDNIKRLMRSCNEIQLPLHMTEEELATAISQTVDKNRHLGDEFDVRIIVTGGISSSNILPEGNPSIIIMVRPLPAPSKENYEKGVKIVTFDAERLFPSAKSTTYITAVIAMKHATSNKAIEAVYVKGDNVYEGTTSNCFIIKNGTLMTPDSHILKGITRANVLKVAEQSGVPVVVKPISTAELYDADEIFLTSASKRIMPVVQVDDKVVGSGVPGPVTKNLILQFDKYCYGK
eukprot:TRINITY_DN12019_c0_g1_i1.p1 TRINITY_DN12019_c0_g1~~TRINITY_DN12019_c0_g1_i1.p1  ORF type:complete len:279 (-),score=65.20 TRINITY_DN12019_c0_g1_i1:70-906(-)